MSGSSVWVCPGCKRQVPHLVEACRCGVRRDDNPGNSGGPLLDTSGRVLGVTTLKFWVQAESLGFAVAAIAQQAAQIDRFWEQFRTTCLSAPRRGRYDRPWFSLYAGTVTVDQGGPQCAS